MGLSNPQLPRSFAIYHMNVLLFFLHSFVLFATAATPPPYAWPHPVDEMEIPQEIFDLGVSNYTRGFLGDTIECGLGSDFIIQNGDGIPYRAWGVSMFKYELWPGVARWSDLLGEFNFGPKDLKISCVEGHVLNINDCRMFLNDNVVRHTSAFVHRTFKCPTNYKIAYLAPWTGVQTLATEICCEKGAGFLGKDLRNSPTSWILVLEGAKNKTICDINPHISCVDARIDQRVKIIDLHGILHDKNGFTPSRASGIILVYDITNKQSFDNISSRIKAIDKNVSQKVVKILVGNKCDLSDRVVSKECGEK
ncbi:hypothetical protein PRIPAC_92849, partial [Pristionchus pacificus]|uniref:Uncharacterized protein n=1 Tax=Pristionchus pacificus TaxID=54126 RepID=A0A2A6BPX6_PRIPA